MNTMANREIISRKDLLDIFKAEAKKFDICTGIYIGPIKSKAPDKNGCNWILSIGGGEKDSAMGCAKSIEKLISLLGSKYNIQIED